MQQSAADDSCVRTPFTHQKGTKLPSAEGFASVFGWHQIANDAGTKDNRDRSTESLKQAEDDKHGRILAHGADDGEYEKSDVGRLHDDAAAVQLAKRRKDERAKDERDNVGRDKKTGERVVGVVEFVHELGDARGEDGDSQRHVEGDGRDEENGEEFAAVWPVERIQRIIGAVPVDGDGVLLALDQGC